MESSIESKIYQVFWREKSCTVQKILARQKLQYIFFIQARL